MRGLYFFTFKKKKKKKKNSHKKTMMRKVIFSYTNKCRLCGPSLVKQVKSKPMSQIVGSSFFIINITFFFKFFFFFYSLTVTSFVICCSCTNHVQYIAGNYHCIFIDLWSYIMVLTFLIRILVLNVYITIYLPLCDTLKECTQI